MNEKNRKMFFTQQLLSWFDEQQLDLEDWKRETSPYKVWLREVILQQTRREQGIPYYQRFITHYPSVFDLANAPEEEVFRLWQGLGYYNRCRNMISTARTIVNEYKGIFPVEFSELLQLKGVGYYTAAAISSFSYGGVHAVLDGNVFRILSRYFVIDTPIDSTQGKKIFKDLANELINPERSADFNQAIMDFGSSICAAYKPSCEECVLKKHCHALSQNTVNFLPVKSKKIKSKKRYFHYFVIEKKGKLYIQKRKDNDIWQGLHQFLLVETLEAKIHPKDYPEFIAPLLPIPLEVDCVIKQQLTHQLVHSMFYKIDISKRKVDFGDENSWFSLEKIKKIAFPKTIISFLNQNDYF